jgi:outer membrane protein assembly factor BamB
MAVLGTPTALWRIPASGGQPEKVLDAVVNSSFAVLETGIYYIDQPGGGARLRYYDFARRAAAPVADNLGNAAMYGGFAASPDGRAILYARTDSSVDDLMLVENFR